MNKIYVLVALLLATNISMANSNFGTKTVEKVYFHDSGQFRIVFKEVPGHSEPCTNKSIYIIEDNHKYFKEMVSGLLAALHSGNKVGGWVNGCKSSGASSYPIITRLDLFGSDDS